MQSSWEEWNYVNRPTFYTSKVWPPSQGSIEKWDLNWKWESCKYMFERANIWECCCNMWKIKIHKDYRGKFLTRHTKDENEDYARCLSTIKRGVCYNENDMSCVPKQAITSATYMMMFMSCCTVCSKFLYYTKYRYISWTGYLLP